VVGGGVGWSYVLRRRRAAQFSTEAAAWLMVGDGGVGGVRPDERALEHRTRWTGVFSGFKGAIHFTCDLC